jgi:hypothetical protein
MKTAKPVSEKVKKKPVTRKKASQPEVLSVAPAQSVQPVLVVQPVPTTVRLEGLAVPEKGLKLLAFCLAFIPPMGFLLGVIFQPQSQPEAKRFGQQCLLLAGIGLLVAAVLGGIFSMMHAAAGSSAGVYF